MRSMLLLTKYNLFLHYQPNPSCGSWVGYNSECHWMMDWPGAREWDQQHGPRTNIQTDKHHENPSSSQTNQSSQSRLSCGRMLIVTSLEIMSFDLRTELSLIVTAAMVLRILIQIWWPDTDDPGRGNSISIIMTLLELINKRHTYNRHYKWTDSLSNSIINTGHYGNH